MENFPIEVLTQIIQKMDKRDWLVISTTCRTLCTISRPFLYEEVDARIDTTPRGRVHQMVAPLPKSEPGIMGGPPLTCWVRTLNLRASESYNQPYFKNPLMNQLGSFSNLETLKLYNLALTFQSRNAIQTLQKLKSLTIASCSAGHSTLMTPPQWNLKRNLWELVIKCSKSGTGWDAFVPSGLQSLIVDQHDGENRLQGIFLPSTLSRIMLCGICDSLTKLEWKMGPHVPLELISLIEICPQICFLSFGCSHPFFHFASVNTLSARAIPKLAHFSGPAECAEVCIKNRPVHSAALHFRIDTPINVLAALRLSSVRVQRLELHPSQPSFDISEANAIESVLQCVPESILYMKWSDKMRQENLSGWKSALSQTTALRVFEFGLRHDSYSFDISPKDIVYNLFEACSSLQEVTCPVNGHYRRYIWRNDIQNKWEEYHVV